MYTIYEHISPSGKVYIGQTCQKPNKRWGKEGKNYLKKGKNGRYDQPSFANAINKYGWGNFDHKILIDELTKEEADLIEIECIKIAKSYDLCYNIAKGGRGGRGGRRKYDTEEEAKQAAKEAHKASSRKYKQSHKAEEKARNKAYREANKEKIKAWKKVYYEAHKEENKAWKKVYYEEHKEEIKAKARAYKQSHKH